MYYELVYENGDSSVMSADSDEEALEGIKASHERAIKGEKSYSGDVNSPPAVRIKRVFAYSEHPNEYAADQIISFSEAKEALSAHTKDGLTDVQMLVSSLRGLTDPLVNNPAPHESKFQMKPDHELEEKEWASV